MHLKKVSVPYKITLLSNNVNNVDFLERVSVPYKITLLSNKENEYN